MQHELDNMNPQILEDAEQQSGLLQWGHKKPVDLHEVSQETSLEVNEKDHVQEKKKASESTETNPSNEEETGPQEFSPSSVCGESSEAEKGEDTGRERLKRHRIEVAGRVWIPDIWGQEELLKDWIDCSAFDASLRKTTIMSARAALVEEGTRVNSSRLRIENSC